MAKVLFQWSWTSVGWEWVLVTKRCEQSSKENCPQQKKQIDQPHFEQPHSAWSTMSF
jgi:hypothetical protein